MKLAKVLLVAALVLSAVGCGKKKDKDGEKEQPVTNLDIKQDN